MQWVGVIIRFVVSALVLIVVSWISPGFMVKGGFFRSPDCCCRDCLTWLCRRNFIGNTYIAAKQRNSWFCGGGGGNLFSAIYYSGTA